MTDYHRFRILTDVPSEDPTLGFRETSEGLASLISSSEARLAMAIFGPWGSGKTTLMEAIKRQLQHDPQVICVDFSAWRYEREEHLIIPLLDTIREALVDWSRPSAARKNRLRCLPPGPRSSPACARLWGAKTTATMPSRPSPGGFRTPSCPSPFTMPVSAPWPKPSGALRN